MRLRAAFCLLAFIPIVALAQDRFHMRILVNGSAVGENNFERTVDSFISKSSLDLGSIKLSGTVLGHTKDGKLVDATFEGRNPGGTMKVVFANGRVDVTAGAKSTG